MTVITETEFRQRVDEMLTGVVSLEDKFKPWGVTGPGRSGAIASVYVSHYLKVPFIPFGTILPASAQGLWIVDTASFTGRTIRRAIRKYKGHYASAMWFYQEPPRVRFWYEDWKE